MPHLCTNCGQSFPDGSKEMLSGCPECGGNKFQYLPESALDQDVQPEEPPSRPGDDGGVTDAVGRAATTVRDYVNRRRDPPEQSPATEQSQPADQSADAAATEADDATVETGEPADSEDVAQASARSEMIEPDDLPGDTVSAGASAPQGTADRDVPPSEGRVVKEPDSPDRPALEELRKELNDQFESIRILEPGQYELNLMELYDREEHIIALQEDGRYIIEVPDTWRDEE